MYQSYPLTRLMTELMQRLTVLFFIAMQFTLLSAAQAETVSAKVKVADPYLEMHTGPSVGYPVFHVIERNEQILVIKKRTDWYLVEEQKKRQGWVHRSQLSKTLTLDNEQVKIKDITYENYLEHQWDMSMNGGRFGGLAMMSLSSGYLFNRNLSVELSVSQILGVFSSRLLLGANLVQQPFPHWSVSPYFTLGTGFIKTSVSSTLSQLKDTTDMIANTGIGFKMYLTRRFILRADVRKYLIFQSRNKNEEITSWQLGFGFFF